MRFKEIREKLNLGQKEFAKYFGISDRTYQKWEYYEEGKIDQGRKAPSYIKGMMLRILHLEGRLDIDKLIDEGYGKKSKEEDDNE